MLPRAIASKWPRSLADLLARLRGKTYLSIAESGAMVVFYVKPLFDKLGVPYPKDDWTYEEFLATARKLTVKGSDGTVVQFGYQANYGDPYYRNVPWTRAKGDLEFDRLNEPRKANFTAPGVVEGFQSQLYDLQTQGIAPLPSQVPGPTGLRIELGKVAMKYEGTWFFPSMYGPRAATEGGLAFDIVPVPRIGGKRVPIGGASGHVLVTQSKQREAAWQLVKFIGEETAQKRVAENGRGCNIPEFMERLWAPIATRTFNFQNARAFIRSYEEASSVAVGSIDRQTMYREAGFQAATDAIAAGTKTARAAMAEVNPKIQYLLDTYWPKYPQ